MPVAALFSAIFSVKRAALSGAGTFVRIAGGQNTATGSTRWSIGFAPSNDATSPDGLFVELRNSAGTVISLFYSSIGLTSLNTWYRVAISSNRNAPGTNRLRIDDVDRLGTVVTNTDAAIDFTVPFAQVGAKQDSATPTFCEERE